MFYENLKKICAENGITLTGLLKKLDVSTGTIGHLKKGGKLSSDVVRAIALELNISTDRILEMPEKIELEPDPPAYVTEDVLDEKLERLKSDLLRALQTNKYDGEPSVSNSPEEISKKIV